MASYVKIGNIPPGFRSKTLTVKNKNRNFQYFLSPFLKTSYEQRLTNNSKIFDSKLHTPLIIEALLFCLSKNKVNMKLESKITNNQLKWFIEGPVLRSQRRRGKLSRIITYFLIYFFMQNKAKVKYAKINVCSFVTSVSTHLGHLVIWTNKAKTNPIQTQFNPKQSQFNPKQTQFKANLSNGQN